MDIEAEYLLMEIKIQREYFLNEKQ